VQLRIVIAGSVDRLAIAIQRADFHCKYAAEVPFQAVTAESFPVHNRILFLTSLSRDHERDSFSKEPSRRFRPHHAPQRAHFPFAPGHVTPTKSSGTSPKDFWITHLRTLPDGDFPAARTLPPQRIASLQAIACARRIAAPCAGIRPPHRAPGRRYHARKTTPQNRRSSLRRRMPDRPSKNETGTEVKRFRSTQRARPHRACRCRKLYQQAESG
jgi:hypothetical protein